MQKRYHPKPDSGRVGLGAKLIRKKTSPIPNAQADFRAVNGSQLAARAKRIPVTLPTLPWDKTK